MNKKSAGKKLFLFLFCLSVGTNVVFFSIDIVPYFIQKSPPLIDKNISLAEYRSAVENGCEEMMKTNATYMSMHENVSFIARISTLKNRKKQNYQAQFNYPKAYLFGCWSEYMLNKNDSLLVLKLKKAFNKYLQPGGIPAFTIDKPDQAPFGLAATNLYLASGEKRYLVFADSIYNYLIAATDKQYDLILYRKNTESQLVDLIGLVCPFLIAYGKAKNDSIIMNKAYRELNYYIDYGSDPVTGLPFHSVHLETGIKTGPGNWGRGIGWYALALAYTIKNTDIRTNPYYNLHVEKFELLLSTLHKMKGRQLFGQFPLGSGLDFDASASALMLYSMELNGKSFIPSSEALPVFISRTTQNGFITGTSGDTYGVNFYSSTESLSELSQAFLLLYLSLIKE